MYLFTALTVGFLLGIRHALDADHLVAVSTVLSRSRKLSTAAWIGAFWGAGHSLVIFLVGGAIIWFKLSVPAGTAWAAEFLVGAALVLLGFLNFFAGMGFELWRFWGHEHEHEHDGEPGHSHHLFMQESSLRHSHFHPRESLALGLRQGGPWRSFVVGMVHGLAGSAAVALLVLGTLPGAFSGILYLVFFGAGTTVGMLAFSLAIGAPMMYALQRSFSWQRFFGVGTGLLSAGFGFYLMYAAIRDFL
ncbi:MAG: high-affinity nickel-transport family protein [Elusimicrobia bacterium]|nr:high-affinity nickel-transport family protein [Elusimicrobiota bacterium]